MFVKPVFLAVLAAMILTVPAKAAKPSPEGDIRIQFLSPTLVRLEQRGPKGFEDRNTFTIVNRPKTENVGLASNHASGLMSSGNIDVLVPDGSTLKGVTIKLNGKTVYICDGQVPPTEFFPAPGSMPTSIAIADNPRIVPPKWGASAPPSNNRTRKETSGWDLSNQALDIYVFLPTSYEQFRKEFLSLTGPTEMPPLFDFGLWHSRYHPYSEQEALDVIDRYRKDDIPIDCFVVDTDWRVGASDGYAVNTKLFPDMKRFIEEAHSRHVKLMYNDHPEPLSEIALDPKEMRFREEGLDSLLKMGADVWWYDRNWHTTLREPAPGLPKEVWGAAVFHDITQRAKPGQRPLIMSNVPGIDNGQRHYAPHPAAHRYPVWWTGDTRGQFDYLQHGIANAVDAGVESLLPYMSEDLGGHFGNPTPEVYARFIEYGALSPMMRLHCTAGETRDPWAFGEEVEGIVQEYAKMRYRLLPTIYSAARRTFEDGTPLVRRCDLEWPNEKEARRNDQYLLGDDILVAPIMTSMFPTAQVVGPEWFHSDGKTGLKAEYFGNRDVKGTPLLTRVDPNVDFDWADSAAAPGVPDDNFSVRWSGMIGPIKTTGDYVFQTVTDDGVRVWIDGKTVIDRFVDMDHGTSTGTMHLEAGKSYAIRMDYFDSGGGAAAKLMWILPNEEAKDYATRQVWIPPGEWMDLWTGDTRIGPEVIDYDSNLETAPMFARVSSLIFLAPEMKYTGEKPWNEITIDAYAPRDKGSVTRTLYEDDTLSNDYKKGKFTKTNVSLSRQKNVLKFKLTRRRGSFAGNLDKRTWILQVHVPGHVESCNTTVDGRAVKSELQVDITTPSDDHWVYPFSIGANPYSATITVRLEDLSTLSDHSVEVRLG